MHRTVGSASNFAQPSGAGHDDKALCPECCAHHTLSLEPAAIRQRTDCEVRLWSLLARCAVHERGIHEEHIELSIARHAVSDMQQVKVMRQKNPGTDVVSRRSCGTALDHLTLICENFAMYKLCTQNIRGHTLSSGCAHKQRGGNYELDNKNNYNYLFFWRSIRNR